MSSRVYGDEAITIGDRTVSSGEPCYIIAEAGSNRNCDFDTAIALIDAAADAGADAVKFQTYSAEGLYSKFTPTMSYLQKDGLIHGDETVWDLIKRIELP